MPGKAPSQYEEVKDDITLSLLVYISSSVRRKNE